MPGIGADFVQPYVGVLAAASNVLADQIQLGGGDVEGVAALIGDFDIVLDGAVHLDLLHADKPSDAVVFVHHQIAGGQVGKGVQLLPVGGAGFLRGLSPLRLAPGDELALGEDCQPVHGVFHSVGQAALGQQNLPRLGQGGEGDADERGQVFAAQHLLQNLGSSASAAEHQSAEFLLLVVGKIGSGGVQIAAVAGQLLGGHGQQHLGRALLRVGGAAEGVEIQHCPAP